MKRKLQASLGLLLGVVLLWLLFGNTDWPEVFASIRNVSLSWLLLMQIPIWASFPARVRRWHFIVRSVKPVPFRALFTATQIGFLANFVLPLRAGELIRAFVLGRRADIHLSKGLALVALDRVADLFGLLACMGLALGAVRTAEVITIPAGTLSNTEALTIAPSIIRTGALGGLAGLVLIGASFVVLYVNRDLMLRWTDRVVGLVSRKLATRAHGLLGHFADGLHVLRRPLDALRAIAWSLVVWGAFVVATVCLLEAFHLDYPWYTPFVIQSLLAIAISVPGAPGFVGQFHLAIVVGLVMTVPDANVSEAKAMALLTHLLNLIPVFILGIASLAMEHSGLLELTRRSAEAEAHTQTETAVEQAE